jgi:hypothetical protein
MSVFDPVAGEAGKNAGIARAARAANPEWVVFMEAALIEVARRQPFFFTDDVERIRVTRGGPSTHENRAMGAIMQRAQRNGMCEQTPTFVPTHRAVGHYGPRRVWRSRIYGDW